jgi:RNA polymerase sigma factor (sigma-70 family)
MVEGKSAEFDNFIESFRTNLRIIARGMCRDWSIADDLVQETLIILYRRWENVEPSARYAYSYTVMSHLAERNALNTLRERECSAWTESAHGPQLEDLVVNRLTITDAIRHLTVRQRMVVYLRYWRGLPTEMIARILHMPTGTVRSDLTRATKRLNVLLRHQFYGSA